MELMTERIESIKAGAIGGLSVAVAWAVTSLGNQLILSPGVDSWAIFPEWQRLWLSGASAGVAGFLFGVTYRYIIRDDVNPHLKSGAVFAFGLVRGLAQVEVGLSNPNSVVPVAVMASESILMFAVARVLLDAAIARHWVKPFSSF
ncbi:hypothetical protein [Laspinema olomoucense]|uniref:Uncharacterized protein n=1 Tax=Laspinema olomoucense D3b TaxID=2953688 RepID=A0ABT2NFZ5_9CYAN|nr:MULTISPECIES: hypothetical protein [unclassified Laspinema]MCT7971512.1 hypothetical protein [Laspinema sp. D3d]MCT7980181.1 hypothetical protein [Laspinema sp. D3b]MCT7990964.1 hypothetical protein [Laspinema sp. D3a]MCT7995447.1 hypothetical protein [Laspinema sp. D3c]